MKQANLIEFLIDGRFIKLVNSPIIDFLKFQTNIYPYYKNINHYATSNAIYQLSCKEPEKCNKYKRLGKYGILYSGKSFYTYTHYGKHLQSIDANVQFLIDLIKISDCYYTIPNFKRIDFAYDFYGIDLIELIKTCIIHSKKQLQITYLSYKTDTFNLKRRITCHDPFFCDNIETIYIGTLKSKISFCIYKRHLKLGVTGPITRLEVRFKGAAANDIVSKIQSIYDPKELNSILASYIDKYIGFKVVGSSKSNRLSRYKTTPWWEDFINQIQQ